MISYPNPTTEAIVTLNKYARGNMTSKEKLQDTIELEKEVLAYPSPYV